MSCISLNFTSTWYLYTNSLRILGWWWILLIPSAWCRTLWVRLLLLKGWWWKDCTGLLKGDNTYAIADTSRFLCNSVVSDVYCHERRGHLSNTVLSKLGFVQNSDSSHICDVCHIAKQTRSSFPLSEISSKCCFELVHVDIWGPYHVASISRAKYFLTIVDDCFRAVWTFLMQTKSKIINIIGDFLLYTVNQFGLQVKGIRTNNGTKFLSFECQKNV